MKCTHCGQPAHLMKTEAIDDYTAKRRYRCTFLHETVTLEVLPAATERRALASAVRAATYNEWLWRRDQALLRDLRVMRLGAIAKKYHLTEARIRQIRDAIPFKEMTDEALLLTAAAGCTSYPPAPNPRGLTRHRAGQRLGSIEEDCD